MEMGQNSNRIVNRPVLHGDPAQFGEFGDAGLTAEAAVARCLDAAEGHLRFVMHGGAVDVADAGFDAGGDAHGAFSEALDRLETRVRRYKRRLKDHHIGPKGLSPEKSENAAREVARSIVLRDPDSVEDDAFGQVGAPGEPPPVGMVIAETEAEIRTVTVGRAVLELDMTGYPVVVFRNAAHGGLSVVYRRPDGNVGWIDPERTSKAFNGHGSVNGVAS